MTIHIDQMTSQVEGEPGPAAPGASSGGAEPVDERRIARTVAALKVVARRTRAEGFDD